VACNPPNPTNPTAFFVDYLIYQPSTSVASNISASDPAASSTIFPTAFSTATPSASASTGQNNTVIYALAAVLGVVVLLAIFVIVWLLLGRRQIEHTLKLMAGKLDTDGKQSLGENIRHMLTLHNRAKQSPARSAAPGAVHCPPRGATYFLCLRSGARVLARRSFTRCYVGAPGGCC
jgi:hypothetical protein